MLKETLIQLKLRATHFNIMQQGGRTSTTHSVECNSRLHEMLLKGLAGDFRKNFHNTESPGNIWLLDFTGTFKITSRLFIYLSIYLFSYLFIYLFIYLFSPLYSL